jgi:hypothetical protein
MDLFTQITGIEFLTFPVDKIQNPTPAEPKIIESIFDSNNEDAPWFDFDAFPFRETPHTTSYVDHGTITTFIDNQADLINASTQTDAESYNTSSTQTFADVNDVNVLCYLFGIAIGGKGKKITLLSSILNRQSFIVYDVPYSFYKDQIINELDNSVMIMPFRMSLVKFTNIIFIKPVTNK